MSTGFICSVLLVCCVGIQGATVPDLRVFSVRPACFEYKFTSVVSRINNKPVFALNHLDGQTCFAGVGDKVGPYTVLLHKPVRFETLQAEIERLLS